MLGLIKNMGNSQRALLIRSLLLISISWPLSSVAQSVKRTLSCSFNNSAPVPAVITSTPDQISIAWSDGPVTRLRKLSERQYIDPYGGKWHRMSNSDFLGLWYEDSVKRSEITCR
jgi:hypothetical protein